MRGIAHIGGGHQVEGVKAIQPNVAAPELEPRSAALRHPALRRPHARDSIKVAARHRHLSRRGVRDKNHGYAGVQNDRHGTRVEHSVEITKDRPMAEKHCTDAAIFAGMKTVSRPAPHHRDDTRHSTGERRLTREYGRKVRQWAKCHIVQCAGV